MGLLTESVRGLRASIPFPGSGRGGGTFLGWGDNAYLGNASQAFRLPGERDVRWAIGDGGGTALISAAVNWMSRELVPVRPMLTQFEPDDLQHEGVPTTIRRHAVIDLLQKPNPFHSGTSLRQACAMSYLIDGNVYRVKIRSAMRRVVAEWWLPHWCVVPYGRDKFIDFYRYTVAGNTVEIDPADITHLRFGLDPLNPRRGLSPLRGVLREAYTDEEYARFSSALAHNMGFPGAVIIPGQGVEAKKEVREEMVKTFDDKFTGDGRGRTIALSANAEVKFLQWSPKDLDLSSLRDVPEERVSAAVGIPAAVLGFGTGLQQVKVGATMRELRAMGWEGALIPFLEQDAQTDTAQLLPEFIAGRDLSRTECAYDLSRIAALSEMHLRKAEIEATLVRARIKKVDESRAALGLPAVGGTDGGFQASPGVGGAGSGFKADPGRTPEGASLPAGPEVLAIEAGETETGDDDDDIPELAEILSRREEEVVVRAARGLANKAIAADLGLAERTVERYLATAKEKLGVTSRVQLVRFASDSGLAVPERPALVIDASAKQAEAVLTAVARSLETVGTSLGKNAEAQLEIAKAVTRRRTTTTDTQVKSRDERGRMKTARQVQVEE